MLNSIITVVRRLTIWPTIISLILPRISNLESSDIILSISSWPAHGKLYTKTIFLYSVLFTNNSPKKATFIIMPYLYLSYRTTIKVSHIITSTSKKYENTYTNTCLQLGLIHYFKLESPGFCGITLGCPGCWSSNHTWAMIGIEKSNIYQFFKIL